MPAGQQIPGRLSFFFRPNLCDLSGAHNSFDSTEFRAEPGRDSRDFLVAEKRLWRHDAADQFPIHAALIFPAMQNHANESFRRSFHHGRVFQRRHGLRSSTIVVTIRAVRIVNLFARNENVAGRGMQRRRPEDYGCLQRQETADNISER